MYLCNCFRNLWINWWGIQDRHSYQFCSKQHVQSLKVAIFMERSFLSGIIRLLLFNHLIHFQMTHYQSTCCQVFRALRSILYGFSVFFTACNRHRLRYVFTLQKEQLVRNCSWRFGFHAAAYITIHMWWYNDCWVKPINASWWTRAIMTQVHDQEIG